MKPASMWARARALGPGMIAMRLSQRAARQWAGTRASLLGARRPSMAPPPGYEPSDFFLSPGDLGEVRRGMQADFPEDRARMLEDAELSLQGSLELLTGGRHAYGPRVDWRLDPTAPSDPWPLRHFTGLDVLRLGEPCDIKIPWEVGRGTHLVRMAQAYVLTGEERFAAGAMAGILDFLNSNPPEFGPQWVTPMEVGLRLIHWIWVDRLCRGAEAFSPAARSRLYGGVLDAARFVAAFPEREPVSGNHYWFNGLGLWYAGLLGGPRCRGFARKGRRIVEQELFRQVYPDGMSFEASTGYHRLVTELMLHAGALAELEGEPLSPAALGRVRLMLQFTAETMHAGGRAPQLGDHDDGRVVAFAPSDPLDHRHLLAQGGAWLEWPELAALGAPRGSEALWFPGPSPRMRAPSGSAPSARPALRSGPVAFPEGGVYVLRAGPVHSVWDAGPLGKAGNGVHGHADLLSGEFSVGGRMVLVDSGTFGYSGDPVRRNEFRDAFAHNGILVDGRAWARPGTGSDLWNYLGEVPFEVHRFGSAEGGWVLEASHEGYRHQGIPVTLSRRVFLAADGLRLEVADRVSGEGDHRAELRWHLATADWRPAENSEDLRAQVGPWGVQIRVRAGGGRISMTTSQRSERWGERHLGPLLIAELEGRLPLEFHTCWIFSGSGAAQEAPCDA